MQFSELNDSKNLSVFKIMFRMLGNISNWKPLQLLLREFFYEDACHLVLAILVNCHTRVSTSLQNLENLEFHFDTWKGLEFGEHFDMPWIVFNSWSTLKNNNWKFIFMCENMILIVLLRKVSGFLLIFYLFYNLSQTNT